MKYGIHWFRRDLRVAGNLALQKQFRRYKGKVVGLFCFDHSFLAREDFSHGRFLFFLKTLKALKEELNSVGSDLLFLDIGPEVAFSELTKKLKQLPESVSFSRDYEPFARMRDEKITELLTSKNIDVYSERDHLLIEPWELSKDDGKPYTVFTPFAKKWLRIFQEEKVFHRVELNKQSENYLLSFQRNEIRPFFNLKWSEILNIESFDTNLLAKYIDDVQKKVTVDIPDAGSLAAWKKLNSFSQKINDYAIERDFLNKNATSGLSLYLKNGSLTIGQIIYFLKLRSFTNKQSSHDSFFNELIWREFYYHILYHFPYVEHQSFKQSYQNLKWENNKHFFECWKLGKTGFPIVDAGMRELVQTGHMHNRVRMIVASFLTKDLLIDWRWGEKFFMEHLLDGDLAANNGGWQWAASTGCDAQPYFRIFNPWTQSKKFDPAGEYIKKYLPELEDVNPSQLHRPILEHPNYPGPIVDHQVQREKALFMYKK